MEKRICYNTTPAQDVVILQLRYTLFKRVVNILASVSSSEKTDWNLMEKAFNMTVARNDCCRIRFEKQGKKLVQYFVDKAVFENIPRIVFSTEEDQEAWVLKTRRKAIDYMHGHVIEPYFINTWDGKYMVFIKVCHTVLDAYGINILFNDLAGVYNALRNGTSLPPEPGSFESLIQKDLATEERNFERDEEYFRRYLNRPMPYYTGIHGDNSVIWKKRAARGVHSMKMFFINNDTESAMHPIDAALVKRVLEWCAEKEKSIASFFLYTFQITSSLVNHRTGSTLSLELCNCRATALEKKTAGTKAQSIMRYTYVDYNRSFEENFDSFTMDEAQLYRHVGFPETRSEVMLHDMYRFGMMDTLYNCTFSLIPVKAIPGFDFRMYSNGKFPLPAYIALMLDVDTNEIQMLYDCQKKVTNADDVRRFHAKYVEVLKSVLDSPEALLSELNEDW